MISLQESSFYSLLPPNLQRIEAKCLSAALDRQMKELVLFALKKLPIYSDVWSLESDMADLLGLIFDIRSYRTDLNLDRKRRLIANALLNYSRMGTAAAVENVTTSIYGGAKIEENWKYAGNPYCFRIKVDASKEIPVENPTERLIETVLDYKNVRSWLDGVRVDMIKNHSIYTAATATAGSFLLGLPKQEREALGRSNLKAASKLVATTSAMGSPKQEREATAKFFLRTGAEGRAGIRLISAKQERKVTVNCTIQVVTRGMAGIRLICIKK